MSTNSKNLYIPRNYGDCPFTNLLCYTPSKFKVTEKPASLCDNYLEQGQGLVVKPLSPQESFVPKLATDSSLLDS